MKINERALDEILDKQPIDCYSEKQSLTSIANWLNTIINYKSKKLKKKVIADTRCGIEFDSREDDGLAILFVRLTSKTDPAIKSCAFRFDYYDKEYFKSIFLEDHLIDFLNKIYRLAESI